ncbi:MULTISPECIES: SLATT domain-containing protein [unclassified Mesorhizobium]|uniref:SLATT domain-containing protein n=1 Tax=unclassified Mesorhizobium TaxID=325217 RepID=UPI001128A0B0|nr:MULTISPECIES: SLATT domain-containing protein [unclassified Mesorhizobium]TPK42628.1 SLATT domain-containing protein [Mesorhizobium sp. B2-5-2]TPL26748.1 SLATT domain-containing protein [Mesorhizobium sp. B2-4-7]TPM76800.1 SLATT domain-containing protein [Mesorhizobium sp. B2-1-6]TPN72463.1 SLATT domain-containing protein [Mesorhizobium sp. B1-1-2]
MTNDTQADLIRQAKDQLLKEMKRGKGSRFNASKRLEKRDQTRTNIVAYASVSVIVLTLLPVFFSTARWLESLIALLTVGMSLLILAFSLLQAQAQDPVKADQFHRCATEINELRRRLRAKPEVDSAELELFGRDYDAILRRYSINHDDVDYDRYRVEHPDEFPGSNEKQQADAKRHVTNVDRLMSGIGAAVITATVASALAASLASPEFLDWVKEIATILRH